MPQLHPLTLTTLVRRARQDGCDDIYYYYAALHCMVLQCTLTAYQAKTQIDGHGHPERLLQEEHFQPLPNTSSFEESTISGGIGEVARVCHTSAATAEGWAWQQIIWSRHVWGVRWTVGICHIVCIIIIIIPLLTN